MLLIDDTIGSIKVKYHVALYIANTTNAFSQVDNSKSS